MRKGITVFQMRGKPCTEAEFIAWLVSIGGECDTQPQPVFDDRGYVRGYASRVIRVVDGRVVVEEDR